MKSSPRLMRLPLPQLNGAHPSLNSCVHLSAMPGFTTPFITSGSSQSFSAIRTGPFGGVMSDTSGFVAFSDIAAWDTMMSGGSIMAVINVVSVGATESWYSNRDDSQAFAASGAGRMWTFKRASSGNYQLTFFTNVTNYTAQATATVGQHVLVVTFDATTVTMYVDGVSKGTASPTGTPNTGSTDVRVGSTSVSAGDEVLMVAHWARVLPPFEVTRLSADPFALLAWPPTPATRFASAVSSAFRGWGIPIKQAA